MVLGILGYVGLLMSLKQNKQKKGELVNFIFLLLGITGFVVFTTFVGGIKAWKWIITVEEPDEWLMFTGPILITFYLMIRKGKRLLTMNKDNAG